MAKKKVETKETEQEPSTIEPSSWFIVIDEEIGRVVGSFQLEEEAHFYREWYEEILAVEASVEPFELGEFVGMVDFPFAAWGVKVSPSKIGNGYFAETVNSKIDLSRVSDPPRVSLNHKGDYFTWIKAESSLLAETQAIKAVETLVKAWKEIHGDNIK